MFKKYTKRLCALLLIMFVAGCVLLPAGSGHVQAADTPPSTTDTPETCTTIAQNGGVNQNVCLPNATVDPAGENCKNTAGGNAVHGCGIVAKYINPAIAFFSAIFGVIVTIMIILGGIQYASAEGDPQKVASAKKRIFNALFALLAFGLLYGFLNFLIPGGL